MTHLHVVHLFFFFYLSFFMNKIASLYIIKSFLSAVVHSLFRNNGLYYSYTKPNEETNYIHVDSENLPSVIKQLSVSNNHYLHLHNLQNVRQKHFKIKVLFQVQH